MKIDKCMSTTAAQTELIHNDEISSLPFTVSVTPLEKPSPVPCYLEGVWSDCGDYPPCVVSMDCELWVIHSNAGWRIHRHKGTNFENAVKQPDGSSEPFPVERPYMLGGMWYDDAEKKLYAPLHCETPGYPTIDNSAPGSSVVNRQIHLASSTDKGLNWRYEGAIVTRDDPAKPRMAGADYSGLSWDGGDGDFRLFVDHRGGYIYLFSLHYVWPKPGTGTARYIRTHVARCAIADKMAPGKWRKFYNGDWAEAGLGGRSSNVNGYCVMFNTYLNKYISFHFDSTMSVCSDLSKQDWTPPCKIGNTWMANGMWALHVTNTDMVNVYTGDRTLFLYTYFVGKFGGKYRMDFGSGETLSRRCDITPEEFSSRSTYYAYEPLFESSDPIASRHTRRVSGTSPEMSYTGVWTDEMNKDYYEQQAKVSGTAGSSVEFTFKGSDIYWRAVRGENCGKADVYLDNRLEKTVDCYSIHSIFTPVGKSGKVFNAYQFGFIKTGLDANVNHVIKVVVRGDKNSQSTGTNIKHMMFEYSAESYRASDGFSAIQGKNSWYYQAWFKSGFRGKDAGMSLYFNMRFQHPNWVDIFDCYGPADGKCSVGYFHMLPGAGIDVMRTWVAPHAGTIRVEGNVSLSSPGGNGVNVAILRRHAADVWPLRQVTFGQPVSHDLMVDIVQNDVIYFIVGKIGPGAADAEKDRTTWDQVVTYV